MMKTNLNPQTKANQPTSHVKVGSNKLGSDPGIVEVSHRGASAFFYAKVIDDFVVQVKNKVQIHENIGSLFGGIDWNDRFVVDAGVSTDHVEPCRKAELFVKGATHDEVERFLRETNYLLHPIEEVIKRGDDLVPVDVVSMEPSGYRTLIVTPDTELEFLDPDEYESRDRASATIGGGGRSGEGGEGGDGGRGPGGDEGDVDLDLEPRKPVKSFEDDVAGLEDVERTARTILSLFDPDVREEVESRYGERIASRGGSMLLYGPPGCGKTLVSEAIAYEAKYNSGIEEDYGEVKFIEVTGGDILSRYPGESERRIAAAFDRGHQIAQDGFCVLFFDEVETLIPDRSDDGLQRHERALTNAFLQEMNDIEDNLLVIGATNMPFSIDPAATRRFPIQEFIPQPEEAVMEQVWRKSLGDLPGQETIDFERLAAESLGYTPAEVADRVLGSDLQRELVESVVKPGDPVTPDTDYLLERLEATEPKTVRQYIASVRKKLDDLEGYPELQRYVEDQADELGMRLPMGARRQLPTDGAEGGSPDA